MIDEKIGMCIRYKNNVEEEVIVQREKERVKKSFINKEKLSWNLKILIKWITEGKRKFYIKVKSVK